MKPNSLKLDTRLGRILRLPWLNLLPTGLHFETGGVLECVWLPLSKLPIIIALHLVNLIEKTVPLTFDTKRDQP